MSRPTVGPEWIPSKPKGRTQPAFLDQGGGFHVLERGATEFDPVMASRPLLVVSQNRVTGCGSRSSRCIGRKC